MQTTEFFAKFVGYGVQIENGDKQLASLDLIASVCRSFKGPEFVLVSDIRLGEFMAALERHKGRLQQLNGVPVRRPLRKRHLGFGVRAQRSHYRRHYPPARGRLAT